MSTIWTIWFQLREAEARLTMAEHYRNPYPRPVNLPPRSYTKKEGKATGKAIKKLNELSKPIYVKSIDDSVNQTWKTQPTTQFKFSLIFKIDM